MKPTPQILFLFLLVGLASVIISFASLIGRKHSCVACDGQTINGHHYIMAVDTTSSLADPIFVHDPKCKCGSNK